MRAREKICAVACDRGHWTLEIWIGGRLVSRAASEIEARDAIRASRLALTERDSMNGANRARWERDRHTPATRIYSPAEVEMMAAEAKARAAACAD